MSKANAGAILTDDVETLADRLRRAFWDPDNGGQWEKIAAAVLASDWYAVRIAQAEQRGREDNADHGMCYVSGSKALAAKMAAAWDEGAAAVEFDQFSEEFDVPPNPYRVTP